jgi:hypothetical protein
MRQEYYKTHHEKLLRQMRKYNKENKDKILKYRQENKDKIWKYNRNYRLEQAYGITLEQLNSMIISQGGACAICMEKFKSSRGTHVDHDHKLKRVRQLLCSSCNQGLGYFKENQLTLQRAIEYLRRWEK